MRQLKFRVFELAAWELFGTGAPAERLLDWIIPVVKAGACHERRLMKSKLVSEDGGRTFVLILDQGEEAFAAVTALANERAITAASVVAIGAFEGAKVGWFDLAARQYSPISVDEQCEVLTPSAFWWRDLLVRCRPGTMAAILSLPSSHGLTASSPARGRVVRMLMVLPFQIRIGNRGMVIMLSASITNGSTFLMMP